MFGKFVADVIYSWFQRIAIAYLLTALCEIWLKGDEDVDYGFDLLKRYRYQLWVFTKITPILDYEKEYCYISASYVSNTVIP